MTNPVNMTDMSLPPGSPLKKKLSDITEYTEQDESESSDEEDDSFYFSNACHVSKELDALFSSHRTTKEDDDDDSSHSLSELAKPKALEHRIPQSLSISVASRYHPPLHLANNTSPRSRLMYANDQEAYHAWITESPSPKTIGTIFRYACRSDSVYLTDRLLRDFGMEYLLRHCPVLDMDRVNEVLSSQRDAHSHIENASPVTRMFWAVALHGSFQVLNLLAEEYLAFVVEQCLPHHQKPMRTFQDAKTLAQKAKQLLAHELNQSITVKNSTLVSIATLQNEHGVLSTLLNHGASPLLTNSQGESPLFQAIEKNNVEALQVLGTCPDLDWNMVNREGVPPILCALESAKQYGSLQVLKYLLLHKGADGKPDVDCSVRDINTGLDCVALAARNNLCGVLELFCLLAFDSSGEATPLNLDLFQVTANGDTLIHIAAKYNLPQVISTLIACIPHDKMDFSARDTKERTALHIAAQKGHTSVVQALIKGLSEQRLSLLDVKDASNFTPLQYAATNGHSDITKLLAGVSNMKTMCPIPLARKRSYTQGESQLSTTINVPTLVAAASNGHKDVVHTLVSHGADVNQTDEHGRTAVSVASKAGFAEIVQLLVEKGADLKTKSRRSIVKLPRQKSCK